jgi:hypothetical protein
VSLGNIAGIVLFTQLWPQYHELTLMAGGLIALPLLTPLWPIPETQPAPQLKRGRLGFSPSHRSLHEPRSAVHALHADQGIRAASSRDSVRAILTHFPAVVKALSRFEFQVAAWGFSPIKINLLTTPAVPLLVAIASCYAVRLKKASLLNDFVRRTRHGASSLSTLLFGSATVYLMVSTGQIVFLGQVRAREAGRPIKCWTPL